MFKLCHKYKILKDLIEFYKDKSRKDGLTDKCKECNSIYIEEYYIKNSEKLKRRTRKWRKDNLKKKNKYDRKYQKEHREQYKNYNKKYQHSPKGQITKIKYVKEHPEIGLQANIKQLTKISNLFNKSLEEYKYAILYWSKTVKKRDNKCQKCGSKENLEAHHMLHKAKFPELSLNINNGITLCLDCHYEVHGKQLNLLMM